MIEVSPRACNECPWRKSNQGKKHPNGWYTKKNLRRLWNGLRTGVAQGMLCHPTDQRVTEGLDTDPGDFNECTGALLLVFREVGFISYLISKAPQTVGASNVLKGYRKLRPRGLTAAGTLHWMLGRGALGGFAALLFLFPAAAQVFDPDPSEPDARQQAEFRFIGAMLGMTPPPIGWNCSLVTVWYGRMAMQDAICEPDPLLIEQQERERQDWLDRLVRNSESARVGSGRRR